MATSLSEEFRTMALELVTLFGKEYTIRRRTVVTPDPQRPTKTETTVEDFPCMAALTSWTDEQIKFQQVLREDLQAIVAWNEGLPSKLIPGDQFVDGENVYTIIPPETVLSVNGITVAWQLLVRR